MIYNKTPAGQLAFSQRDPVLHGKLRALFLLIDGVRDHAEVLRMTESLGDTQADIQLLLDRELISASLPTTSSGNPISEITQSVANSSVISAMTDEVRYTEAVRLATAITSKMGLFSGFGLNLAVQKAGNIKELQQLLPKIEAATSMDTTRTLRQLLGLK